MSEAQVRAVQRYYPQIYFACHADHVRRRSTPFRLSSRDSGILSHLSEDGPISPGRLARHVGISASTLSPLLDRLVRLGYADRLRAAGDRRRWEIRLTPKGAEAMAATSVLDGERVERILARLTRAERTRALDGLALLARACRQAARGDS